MQLVPVQHSARVFLALTALLVISTNAILVFMLFRLNAGQPMDKRVKMFGFQTNAIMKTYKERFPESQLFRLYWALIIAGIICFLMFIWTAGFFSGFK